MLPDWLERNAISRYSIHTLGHASPRDLQLFAEAIAPVKVVPSHSFHPEKYHDLFANVQSYTATEWWEV